MGESKAAGAAGSERVELSGGGAPEPRPARRRRAMVSLLLTVMGVILAWIVVILLTPGENADGQCGGIGFGCSLSPQDTLLFFSVFYGLPTLLGIMVVSTIVTMCLLRWTRWRGVVCGIFAGLSAALVVIAAAVLILFVL